MLRTTRRGVLRWSVVGAIGVAGCSDAESTGADDDAGGEGTDDERDDSQEGDGADGESADGDGANGDETDGDDAGGGDDDDGDDDDGDAEAIGGLSGAWPCYQYDAHNGGFVPDGTGPGPESEVTWSAEIGPARGNGGSTPVVGDDAVYVGTGDGAVYALETADGSVRWEANTGKWVHSTPALTPNAVVVGSDDMRIYALDRESGTERWATDASFEVSASPAIVDETAYVTATDGTVYALEVATGDVRWEATIDDVDYLSSPAVDGDRVFVGEGALSEPDARTYVLDADDGSIRWATDAGDEGWTPVLAGEALYATRNYAGDLYALSTEDGSERFRLELGVEYPDYPAVADGTAIVGFEGGLLAVAEDGDVLWECGLPEPASTPAIADETVYAAAAGAVYAVDRADGTVQWSVEYGGDRGGALAVTDDAIYLKDGPTVHRIGT